MIFDLFFECSFKNDSDFSGNLISFRKEARYANIAGTENCVRFNNGYCATLNRRDFQDSFFRADSNYLWIFGYVYTNNRYGRNTGKPVGFLTVGELFRLKNEYPDQWQYLIKGSYVIIDFDENEKVVNAYTDFLNVLPL